MNVFEGSAIARAGGFLRKAWKTSFTAGIIEHLRERYAQSNTRRRWDTLCGRPDPAADSLYSRFLAVLDRLFGWLGNALEHSLFYRIVDILKRLYFRITSGSYVFSLINSVPLRRWVLLLFALYLPVGYALHKVPGLARLASIWEELFILAAAAFIIWRACLRKADNFRRPCSTEVGLLLFMGVGLLLMMINREYPSIALAGYRAEVEYMVWFFLILRLVDDREDAKFLIWAFAAVVFVLCIHGCYQFVVKVPIPASWTTKTEASVRTRVFSITGSPNIFGSLIVMAAPTMAALAYYAKKTWAKLVFTGATGVMLLCDLFTFSRGSWVGLLAAIIVFAFFIDKRLIALMGAAAAAILVAVPSITSRIAYLFTDAYTTASNAGGRGIRWATGRALLMENSPWLGFGLGRFGGAVAMNNQVMDVTRDFKYFYLDNYYLKTLVEMGYIGMIFFILALMIFVVISFKSIYKSGLGDAAAAGEGQDPLIRYIGSDKVVCVGVFSGLFGVLAHCFFENIFEETYMMAYFWGLAAAMTALGLFLGKRTEV